VIVMYMKCKCKNKTFYINVVHQVNGNDDTYEFICAKCGEYMEMGEGDEGGV